MPALGYTYAAEADGARILRLGTGLTQVTSSGTETVNLVIETQDLLPAGEVGDCTFREINVAGWASNGYAIRVTPIVDGVALTAQSFSGSGEGQWTAQAFIAERGTRVRALIETTARTGDVQIDSVSAGHKIIRLTP